MQYVILDRDGVINFDSAQYIKSPEEWVPIPGSLSAIAQLNHYGFKVLIATNQSGIARGYYDESILANIHAKLIGELAAHGGKVEEIFYCPHRPEDECACRKPKPGMLYQMRHKYAIDFAQTFFVGDSLIDIEAAQKTGCLPLLVLTGNGKRALEQYPQLSHVQTFPNLALAAQYIIATKHEKTTKDLF